MTSIKLPRQLIMKIHINNAFKLIIPIYSNLHVLLDGLSLHILFTKVGLNLMDLNFYSIFVKWA